MTYCIQRGAEDQGQSHPPQSISDPFWGFGRRSRLGGKNDPSLKRRMLSLRIIN
jgi:hypothetical protein